MKFVQYVYPLKAAHYMKSLNHDTHFDKSVFQTCVRKQVDILRITLLEVCRINLSVCLTQD